MVAEVLCPVAEPGDMSGMAHDVERGRPSGGRQWPATVSYCVVDGDVRVRAGVLYSSVGDVADFLASLGRFTRHGCSVVLWKRKATEG